MRSRRSACHAALLVAVGLPAALASCGGDGPPEVAAVRFDPPEFASLSDPAWSPREDADDPVVATVGEARIHLSAVQRQVDLAEGALDGAGALERLVEAELLAQEARRRGYDTAPETLRALKHEAVRHLLHDRFVEELGPDEVTRSDIEKAFDIPQVRIRYEHEDGYFVRDAQVVCCEGAADQCRDHADPECFDRATPIVQDAYLVLAAKQPFASADAFSAAVEELRQQYPKLTLKEHSFWFERGVPYDQQKKYTTYFKDWVEAIVALPGEGHIAAPVRSYHAWHIPMLHRHEPAVHKTPEDPAVRREIAEGILPAIRKREFQRWMNERLAAYQAQVNPTPLQLLGPRRTQEGEEGP